MAGHRAARIGSGVARVVVRRVGDRLDQSAVGIAEEEPDSDLVVALLALDSCRLEPALDLCPLLGRDTHAGVIAGPAAFVEREPELPTYAITGWPSASTTFAPSTRS